MGLDLRKRDENKEKIKRKKVNTGTNDNTKRRPMHCRSSLKVLQALELKSMQIQRVEGGAGAFIRIMNGEELWNQIG